MCHLQVLECADEKSYKTEEITVEIREDLKIFRVNPERLLEWPDRGRRGARDSPGKERLKGFLNASICEPWPEATEPGKLRRRQLAEKPAGSVEACGNRTSLTMSALSNSL
jgi:hypothetical protein